MRPSIKGLTGYKQSGKGMPRCLVGRAEQLLPQTCKEAALRTANLAGEPAVALSQAVQEAAAKIEPFGLSQRNDVALFSAIVNKELRPFLMFQLLSRSCKFNTKHHPYRPNSSHVHSERTLYSSSSLEQPSIRTPHQQVILCPQLCSGSRLEACGVRELPGRL